MCRIERLLDAYLCAAQAASSSRRVLGFDFRGHGATRCEDEEDLSIERLTSDCVSVLREVLHVGREYVLVGHSLGACVATRVAHELSEWGDGLVGLVAVDFVEATAMEAIGAMTNFLEERPSSFGAVGDAIDWTLRKGVLHNRATAEVSVPSQLICVATEQGERYRWRTDAVKFVKRFAEGWFAGTSKAFLACQTRKLLLLSGTDVVTSDKELMVGQMQGQFGVKILPRTGHVVQEDEPALTAQVIVSFMERNKIKSPPGLKTGQLFAT